VFAMKNAAMALGACVVALTAAAVVAQTRPNFAGAWIADRPAAAGTGEGGEEGGGRRGRGGGAFSGVNQTTTITQDATTLKAVFPQSYTMVALTYNLDGSETKNTVPTNYAPEVQVSTAAWEADTLVITTTTAAGVRQTRTLSLAAGKLVVETSTPGAGGKPVVSQQSYTKAPDAPAGRRGRGGRAGGEGAE
jgi:hypothetical protein